MQKRDRSSKKISRIKRKMEMNKIRAIIIIGIHFLCLNIYSKSYKW